MPTSKLNWKVYEKWDMRYMTPRRLEIAKKILASLKEQDNAGNQSNSSNDMAKQGNRSQQYNALAEDSSGSTAL